MSDPTGVMWVNGQPVLLGKASCCTEWVIILGAPVGRCGLCGEVPK